MTTPQARIAVIGGGIAGAAACLRLQAHEYQPVWIAPAATQDDKPGEHLAPAARTLLQQLRAHQLLDAPYHRASNTLFSAWGSDVLGERNAAVHLEGPGTVLNRPRFEADLCQLAMDRGCEHYSNRLTSATWKNDQWLLEIGDEQFSADYLLDASGRHAFIAKQYANRFRADQLIAAVGFLTQDPESEIEPTPATLIETVADGWWYAALLADGRLTLNYYSDPKLLPANLSRDGSIWSSLIEDTRHIKRWIEEAGFRIDSPPHLHSAGISWIAPCVGEGWLAIGDAAAAFDPLSSHGMTTALWTAIQGADVAIEVVKGERQAAKGYAQRVATGVHEFLLSRTQIYAQETRYSDSDFWSARQHISPLINRQMNGPIPTNDED